MLIFLSTAAFAAPLTLEQAMTRAAEEAPAAAIDGARAAAARAEVGVARGGLLPDLNVSGAATWGTGNVVAGGLFTPAGFPTVSGPPLDPSAQPAGQALGGVTARLDVLALVEGIQRTDAALAAHRAMDARNEDRALARAVAGGLAWLDAAEARDGVEVARVDLDRARRVFEVAEALATAGVRPGVEAALAASELALAEQRVARAEGSAEVALVRLRVALGSLDPVELAPDPGPAGEPSPAALDGHPRVEAARDDREAASSRLAAARTRFAPRLALLGAGWVRTGTWPADEPSRTVGNGAVGAVIELPLLDLPTRRAEAAGARAARDEADARLRDAHLAVEGQRAEADASLRAAREVSARNEAVLEATRQALAQAEARYEAGLIDVSVVAVATSRAREAELVALRARFDVTRAALALAYARGDLSPWMDR